MPQTIEEEKSGGGEPPSKDCCHCPTSAILIRSDAVDRSGWESTMATLGFWGMPGISPDHFHYSRIWILKVVANETEAGSCPPPHRSCHTSHGDETNPSAETGAGLTTDARAGTQHQRAVSVSVCRRPDG